MSMPPIHQKNALVAALSASSWSWANPADVQLEQLTWTFRASMMANPPPANGSTRSCAGKASAPTMIRRRLLRSEEHTSELQSPCNLVCRLLLEKKKNTVHITMSRATERK